MTGMIGVREQFERCTAAKFLAIQPALAVATLIRQKKKRPMSRAAK